MLNQFKLLSIKTKIFWKNFVPIFLFKTTFTSFIKNVPLNDSQNDFLETLAFVDAIKTNLLYKIRHEKINWRNKRSQAMNSFDSLPSFLFNAPNKKLLLRKQKIPKEQQKELKVGWDKFLSSLVFCTSFV